MEVRDKLAACRTGLPFLQRCADLNCRAFLDGHILLKKPVTLLLEIDGVLPRADPGDCGRCRAFGLRLAGGVFISSDKEHSCPGWDRGHLNASSGAAIWLLRRLGL